MSKSIASGARAIVVDSANPIVARLVPPVYGLLATGGITFIEFSALYEEIFDRVPLRHLSASRLIETLPRHRILYDVAKRAFDIILALLAAVVATPFIAVAAIIPFV